MVDILATNFVYIQCAYTAVHKPHEFLVETMGGPQKIICRGIDIKHCGFRQPHQAHGWYVYPNSLPALNFNCDGAFVS